MLSNVNKTENVKQQYRDDKNLSTRINLHAKHGTNKQSFSDWLFGLYGFFDNCHILELGCGNGAQWEAKIDGLPDGCRVFLSDFTEGMVNAVREKYRTYPNFEFKQIDIQEIPFPDETFDIAIANHMLYHIPDLNKALSEVKRILKPNGTFYASTFSENSLHSYLRDVIKQINPKTNAFTQSWSFTMQNGFETLSSHFDNITRLDYESPLAITDTQDLMDWIKSTMSINHCSESELHCLYEYFEEIRKRDGVIHIPNASGVFVSKISL